MHTLPDNYQKNIDILKENIKRGLTAGQAMSTINNMREQFVSHNMYNADEVAFINAMLAEVEKITHLTVVEQ